MGRYRTARLVQKAIGWAILLAVCVAAWFVLRHQVLFLDSFGGVIVERIEDKVATVDDHPVQGMCYYYWRIRTDDGREVQVEVDQLLFFRSREGMRVQKGSFTTALSLIE